MSDNNIEIFRARVRISLVVSFMALGIAGLSIYLGYDLFRLGATGGFKFTGNSGGSSVGFESVAPGLGFAFFGAALAIFVVFKMTSSKH